MCDNAASPNPLVACAEADSCSLCAAGASVLFDGFDFSAACTTVGPGQASEVDGKTQNQSAHNNRQHSLRKNDWFAQQQLPEMGQCTCGTDRVRGLARRPFYGLLH